MNLKLIFTSRVATEHAGQDSSVRSHRLTFSEQTEPSSLIAVGQGTNSLSIAVTREVSETFVLGTEYDITITPPPET